MAIVLALAGCGSRSEANLDIDGDASVRADVGVVDASMDAFVPPRDAGSDSGFDANVPVRDASGDTGVDAFVPALDAGTDGNVDAFVPSQDAGVDAAIPIDAGTDATTAIDAGDAGALCPPGLTEVNGVCELVVDVPRQVAPLSTATVTSQSPTLRWSNGPDVDETRIEVCADRAMTSSCLIFDASGESAAPPAPLSAGVWFWRVRARVGLFVSTGASPVWQFHVGARSAPVDVSWGSTLDVNGDGYADVAVGDHSLANVHVFLGGPTGVSDTAETVIRGTVNTQFGWSVNSAGDIDGDGYGDLIVASMYGVTIYLGGSTGVTSQAVALSYPGGFGYGAMVASAGDLNGDGYADVVVTGRSLDNWKGRGFVFYGSADGLARTPSVTLMSPSAAANNSFGFSVASAGDVNGDGFGDLVFGSNFAAGGAYVYLGTNNGIAPIPDTTLQDVTGTARYYGLSSSSAGDVNGDGYADVLVTGYGQGLAPARADLYFGNPGGLSSRAGVTVTSPGAQSNGYGFGASRLGDINADGFDDFAVGAYAEVGSTGAVYVYLGDENGSIAMPTRLEGLSGAGGGFGNSVAGAGDVNRDGYADMIVGANGNTGTGGHAYVFTGNSNGMSTTPQTTLSGGNIPMTSFGYSVAALVGFESRPHRTGSAI